MKLLDWILLEASPWAADSPAFYLRGTVKDHRLFRDGERINTTPVVKANKATSTVQTRSGSTYELVGAPDPDPVYAAGGMRQKLFEGGYPGIEICDEF